jgi:putative transposase
MKIEENCYYHLYNRGNNKGDIFFDPENYYFFIKLFKKHVSAYIDVYAYCLMPNHFHFFIRVNNKINFERGIKNMFISYTKSINSVYKRVGGLFQGRYKVKEVNSESYFTRIIIYIHQNPKKAGLVKNLENYPYSSFGTYLSDKPTSINKKEVLDWFKNLNGFIEDHKF